MAIVASGENANLADALAASTLAGANAPAPIVLTQNATYSAEAKSALAALKGKGVTKVTIVGGTAAVATSVEDAIKADGFTVTRVAGANRFATAAAIAAAANTANAADPIGGKDVAFIASGFSFADALAGSPAAASGGIPLLLVNADSIPAETTAALDALDISQAVILGGTVPVSDAVASQLQTLTGTAPTRLAGANRFATAAAIGDYEVGTLGFAATSAILANGVTLVDALSAGPLGGILEAPIVLTASLPAESQAWLDTHSDTIAKLYVTGGTAAVDDATVTAATTAAKNTANDPARAGASQTAVLNGPELQSVTFSDIDTDEFGTGGELSRVEYTFTFDTELDDSVDESLFHLYDANTTERSVGEDPDVSGNSVAVWFPFGAASPPPSPPTSGATLASVETGAVEDEDGNENPGQSIALSPLSATPSHLIDAEQTDEDDGVVTFVFSSPLPPEALGNFNFTYVLEDGTTDTIAGGTADVVGDEGDDDSSANIEVTYDSLADDPDTDDDTIDDIARVYVEIDTVIGPLNIQNVDFSDVDESADLDNIELPADNSELDDDEVLFTFDEDIDTADADEFHLYYGVANGGFVNGQTVSIDGSEVTVSFDEEAVNSYVAGGWVDDLAVGTDADSTDDEGGAANSIADGIFLGYTAVKGVVAGPQLDSAAISQETDSFGNFEEFQVTLTFTKELADNDSVSGISVWINDGDDLEEVSLDACETDNDNQVVCTDDDDDSEIQDAVVVSVEYESVFTADTFNIGGGSGFADVDTDFGNPEASFEASIES